MVEKSIRFGLSLSSVDQCQGSSLKKVRYDANILKCERAHAKNSEEPKVGIEPARLTGTELENSEPHFLSLSMFVSCAEQEY